jgi:ferric-dicitrate binding protein FerR (iron transport regulator)/regulation of enolase protein 1 (concanavalin A-like superfamily)
MKPLDELLLKWHDRNLTVDELAELNVWLTQTEARARLRREFDFDADLLEAIKALHVLTSAQEQAQAFQTLEVRQTEPFPRRPGRRIVQVIEGWIGALAQAAGRLRWKAALVFTAALGLAGAVWWFWPTREVVARIQGSTGDVLVQRGGHLHHAGTGFGLRGGDIVKTAADAAMRLVYPKEATRITVQGGTQLKVEVTEEGKRWELTQGTLAATVAPQPKEHALVITTPQAEAKVLGTEFSLAVTPDATRLEVVRGTVQFARREDGKSVMVNCGTFALAGPGTELVARSLLPSPWNSQDIGAVKVPGHARFDGKQCKVRSAGKNSCRIKDEFHFVYQTLEGDGEIRARVVDVELTSPLAKAGVVIRRDLKTCAPHAFLALTAGGGMEFEHRARTENCIDWAGGESAPSWVRLDRRGDTITAYKSYDGAVWTEIGSDMFPTLGSRIYVGLAATSYDKSKLTTAVFDNISVVPAHQ